MTIQEVIAFCTKYDTTLSEEQLKEFFAQHDGNPTPLDLVIYLGDIQEDK